MKYDFSGWATRNNLKCSDGRTILKDAFKENDGKIVPLVWNHQHNDPNNVLGHALLENRDNGVYAYCVLNDTEQGRNAKMLVSHGDITALSIYANQLKQQGSNVLHGAIREVSLVLAGANPGAFIDSVINHSEGSDEEAVIYTNEEISLYHSEDEEKETKEMPEENTKKERTVGDVFETLNEEQKQVVYALIGQALADAGKGGEKENEDVKHNLFENEMDESNVLSHSEMEAIFADGKRYGSLKDSVLAHGVEDIEFLFPDDRNVTNTPTWVKREDSWVKDVMNGVNHTPFSRIKSLFADITEDDARAKGYLPDHTHRDAKGNLVGPDGKPAYKKEEVFSLLKRTTSPTTIYKKQKLDRDDVVDITDFDVVAWIKTEMRGMLDEEIARAILFGDGRLPSSDEKINEQNIRPIATDSNFFTIKARLEFASTATEEDKAKAFIKAAVKARVPYRGSGSPTLFVSEDMLVDLLLLEDGFGHRLYKNDAELASAMRVTKIVSLPTSVMPTEVRGLIVNLKDYNVGADKGGSVNMFDDFDIDYNAQKYLIETRCSGALVKPYSAIVIYENEQATAKNAITVLTGKDPASDDGLPQADDGEK